MKEVGELLGFALLFPDAFFNCQPHRLTLGPEILDKSLFIIAFLQAK